VGAALAGIPRVSPAIWQTTPAPVRWLIVTRAGVLVMTLTSALLAGLLAWQHPDFDPVSFGVCLLGLLLAHAASNLLNDLTDYRRGVDSADYFRARYGVHVLTSGLMTPGGLLAAFVVVGGLALATGFWLVFRVGPSVLPLLVAGAVLLLFYTWPLKQLGLGEPAVLLVWGPLMVGGTHLAATGVWDWQTVVIGTVFALGPTAVIFGKHIDKLSMDAAKGIRTLPVRLGEARARSWVRGIIAAQYGATLLLVLTGWLPWLAAVSLFAARKGGEVWRVCGRERPVEPPEGYPEGVWPLWFAAYAFDHSRVFGGLFLAGLAAGLLF
jgi:1,4-dihydroxy-2-naphthoate octaprenyltransferase